MASNHTQSNVLNHTKNSMEASIDELIAKISMLKLTSEALEQFIAAIHHSTVGSKNSGDTQSSISTGGLSSPKQDITTTLTLPLVCSTHATSPINILFNTDSKFNVSPSCGVMPSVSPALSWPSNLGSSAFSPVTRV
ncbi:hypothetical protein V8B97DRAFT_2008494 [Scleroderma yunnanense]